jgi:hypothetical protein
VCYGLAAQALSKIEHYGRARIAADRATVYADLSGSALAAAAAAREMAIVLRHQGQDRVAQQLVTDAAATLDTVGLSTDAQRSAYAQMLCTTAYTAAQSGDRGQALAMIRGASDAARGLPDMAPKGRLFPLTPAAVAAYAVSVHWALGDSGTALGIGSRLLPQQFATAERRGRFHTDMARAWWQWGKPGQAAAALLDVGAERRPARGAPQGAPQGPRQRIRAAAVSASDPLADRVLRAGQRAMRTARGERLQIREQMTAGGGLHQCRWGEKPHLGFVVEQFVDPLQLRVGEVREPAELPVRQLERSTRSKRTSPIAAHGPPRGARPG